MRFCWGESDGDGGGEGRVLGVENHVGVVAPPGGRWRL